MRNFVTNLFILIMLAPVGSAVVAQSAGDFRTQTSGDWSDPQVWQTYNGSAWVATATPPTGSETVTVLEADSVFVDAALTVTGHLANQGIVDTDGNLTIGDGGTYEHARDVGKVPISTWAEGSTMLITGVETDAPEDRNQNYYNLTFNTPDLLSNLNMDLTGATISGDIHVIDTGIARWYLTSASATESAEVTILGDVIVENGTFAVQGTSSAQTTFTVNHFGNVMVTGGNFSISRGSQPTGTTTWTLFEGDFHMENASSNNSTNPPNGSAFVFAKNGTQTLTLENVEFSGLPVTVSAGTTLDMGASILGGNSGFVVNEGATVATTVPGGLTAIAETLPPDFVILEDNSSYVFNGTEAQVTSDMMPTTVQNLTIDNAAGVTLSQATTINGTLALNAGEFDNTIAFTLGASGNVEFNGGSLLVDISNETDGDDVPRTFYVEQNYPNPFNPSTVISFGLPTAADVSISVYNVLGQQVGRFDLGNRPAGTHTFRYSADGLTAGMYIYRVETATHTLSRTMILLE